MQVMSTAPDITNSRALSIGDVSRRTSVNIETIRYYERIGILDPPARTRGGRRVFSAAAVKRLGFVRRCRELGFTLDEIRALLTLVAGDNPSCEEVRALTEAHLQTVRSKIADLGRMERVLATLVAECRSGVVPDCPIVEALYSPRAA